MNAELCYLQRDPFSLFLSQTMRGGKQQQRHTNQNQLPIMKVKMDIHSILQVCMLIRQVCIHQTLQLIIYKNLFILRELAIVHKYCIKFQSFKKVICVCYCVIPSTSSASTQYQKSQPPAPSSYPKMTIFNTSIGLVCRQVNTKRVSPQKCIYLPYLLTYMHLHACGQIPINDDRPRQQGDFKKVWGNVHPPHAETLLGLFLPGANHHLANLKICLVIIRDKCNLQTRWQLDQFQGYSIITHVWRRICLPVVSVAMARVAPLINLDIYQADVPIREISYAISQRDMQSKKVSMRVKLDIPQKQCLEQWSGKNDWLCWNGGLINSSISERSLRDAFEVRAQKCKTQILLKVSIISKQESYYTSKFLQKFFRCSFYGLPLLWEKSFSDFLLGIFVLRCFQLMKFQCYIRNTENFPQKFLFCVFLPYINYHFVILQYQTHKEGVVQSETELKRKTRSILDFTLLTFRLNIQSGLLSYGLSRLLEYSELVLLNQYAIKNSPKSLRKQFFMLSK